MNPPPPILPALGCVTASANAVATAASTAFPPRARIAAPASQAGDDVHTTRPSFDETPSSGALNRVGAGIPRINANSAIFFVMAKAYPGYGSCESSAAHGDLARRTVSTRRDLQRRRNQFLPVFRSGDARAALPLR